MEESVVETFLRFATSWKFFFGKEAKRAKISVKSGKESGDRENSSLLSLHRFPFSVSLTMINGKFMYIHAHLRQ